jgi:hypothetical protein
MRVFDRFKRKPTSSEGAPLMPAPGQQMTTFEGLNMH